MKTIEEKYREKCATPSDIYEHLPALRRYAEQCEHVTEFGVRTVVSTWALLAGLRPGRRLVSVDLAAPEKHGGDLLEVYELAEAGSVGFSFLEADTREIRIKETDLLFIDTWHVYEQLSAELERHSQSVRKFIILHDTETFGLNGETAGHDGLNRAVTEFLLDPGDGSCWRVKEHFRNNNGLTVLERSLGTHDCDCVKENQQRLAALSNADLRQDADSASSNVK